MVKTVSDLWNAHGMIRHSSQAGLAEEDEKWLHVAKPVTVNAG